MGTSANRDLLSWGTAGALLAALTPLAAAPAQAQNLTASNALPLIQFEDTDGGVTERTAQLEADIPDAADADRFGFELEGRSNNNQVIDIDTDARGDQSIVVDVNGDMGLAGNAVFIDRPGSSARLGIGTTMPEVELQINGISPMIKFVDESAVGASAALEYSGLAGELAFEGRLGQGILTIDTSAPSNSLIIDDDGLESPIGLGTVSPEANLHVFNIDGSSQVLVEDTSFAEENRTLVQLTNNGRPQIRLSNTDSGVNWVTGMGPGDAYVIRRGSNEYRFAKGGQVQWFLEGVPDPIFDYDNSGNLTIAGTLTEQSDVNAKRDIEPVDGEAVLDRVAALPVSTWTYRDDATVARHLGPMAQDFHAAFGLGEDDRHISARDLAGVALAAAKELRAQLRQKDARFARAWQERNARIAALTARLADLEARLAR